MAFSNVEALKKAILLLSIATTGLGCFSHFKSTWTTTICISSYYDTICVKPYEICDLPEAEKCPKIEMERFFVAIVIICCVFSVSAFIFEDLFCSHKKAHTNKTFDKVYHGIAAVLLIVAAALYLVSMEQITDLFLYNKAPGINFRRPEKLAAGVLTVVQGVLCGFAAIFTVSET